MIRQLSIYYTYRDTQFVSSEIRVIATRRRFHPIKCGYVLALNRQLASTELSEISVSAQKA